MAIYELSSDAIKALPETSFSAAGIRERDDIQRLLKQSINIVAPETLIIAEEFSDWEDSKRRIDLLAVDKDANLVVIELKRTEDGGHMELQAIRYAAMISKMTFDKAVEVFNSYRIRNSLSPNGQEELLKFLEWQSPDQEKFAENVKIVLVAAEFSKELTTTVMWMNEHELDITCIRMKPYGERGRLYVDVQQILPLPEAEDYTIKIREKAVQERHSRRANSDNAELSKRFWTIFLAEAKTKTDLHANISPPAKQWISATAGVSGCTFNYVAGFSMLYSELYIDTGDQLRNKDIFDKLFALKTQIEKPMKHQVAWERLDNKRASRIRIYLTGDIREESLWPLVRKLLIDAMIDLESALRIHLNTLKNSQ